MRKKRKAASVFQNPGLADFCHKTIAMSIFELKGEAYIELNKLLKINNLVGSGGEAKMRIRDGEAIVNGEVDTRVRKKLRPGDRVEFGGEMIEVRDS